MVNGKPAFFNSYYVYCKRFNIKAIIFKHGESALIQIEKGLLNLVRFYSVPVI